MHPMLEHLWSELVGAIQTNNYKLARAKFEEVIAVARATAPKQKD